MTPAKFLASGSESGEQTALFMWANMAANFGFAAADDDASYEVAGHALATYGPMHGPNAVPELHDMFAIPNGGLRDKITAGNLKREGVKAGVPDIFLPIPRGGYHGLFVEMKRRETRKAGRRKASVVDRAAGSTSHVQDDWIARLRARGYGAASAIGYEAARDLIRQYLAQG